MLPQELIGKRRAGVLLHVSSLPGRHGIGDLGAGAYAFIDWLVETGCTLWQVLPLSPNGRGRSPYCSWSAFCGNPLLIDLDHLVAQGLLSESDLSAPDFPSDYVDFDAVTAFKESRLAKAADALLAKPAHPLFKEMQRFLLENNLWLKNALAFLLLKRQNGGKSWWHWPMEQRRFSQKLLEKTLEQFKTDYLREATIQFFFDWQWQALRRKCAAAGIGIIGDVAIYVDGDSADVWAHQEMFLLDEDGLPKVVSGVPPDAFCDRGQLWGNPIYDWAAVEKSGWKWWIERFSRSLKQTDAVRIDHFRGFAAYWEIPFGAEDARAGKWVTGPGQRFVAALKDAFGGLPFIVEDLGVIDDDVIKLRDENGLPGMAILQFAFGEGSNNPYLPHCHVENGLVYPGTHDNETAVGWWQNIPEQVRSHVQRYYGIHGNNIAWDLARSALASVSRLAVIPMQDVLELGNEARINDPGVIDDHTNWKWRMRDSQLVREKAARLADFVTLYGRRV